MMDLLIEGHIVPETLLACAPMPIVNERDIASKYREGGPRTSRLPRMPLPIFTDGAGDDADWSVYFPASGIRGALRRCAVDVLYAQNGKGWDLDQFRMLSIGGVKGSGSEASFNLKKARELREKIPLLSLFGNASDMGQSWTKGTLSVGHAIPETALQPIIITGTRKDDVRSDPIKVINYLSSDAVESLTDKANHERRLSATRAELKGKKKELAIAKKADKAQVSVIQAEIDILEKEIAKYTDNGNDVSVQMPLDGYECIPPHTRLKHRFILRNANEAEVGLFLAALRLFAMDPQLGAHANHDCGTVRGLWQVKMRNSTAEPYSFIGDMTVQPFDALSFRGDDLEKLAKSCEAVFVKSANELNSAGLDSILKA